MKPFLLLSHRPEDIEAERELVDVARFGRIGVSDIEQRRLEQVELGHLDLSRYSGIFVGGGPYNVSDDRKDELQLRVEADLFAVTRRAVEDDFPYLGLCYGMGVLAGVTGGVVDREFGETPSSPTITLTDEGRADPMLADSPDRFGAFTGHKEAVSVLPDGAVVLATGERSPHQLVRFGANVYAAQFHPEIDSASLVARLIAYRTMGYYPESEFEETIAWAHGADVGNASNDIIAAFVRRHARD